MVAVQALHQAAREGWLGQTAPGIPARLVAVLVPDRWGGFARQSAVGGVIVAAGMANAQDQQYSC